MGRRELRAEMQSTWSTYTPRVPGTPFRREDLEDAAARPEQEAPQHDGSLPVEPSAALPLTLIARGAK